MKIKRQRTESYIPRKGFKFKLPSETVPDEAFTIKEILQKFTRGIDPRLSKLPDYDTQEELTDEQLAEMETGRDIEDLTDIDRIEQFISRSHENEKKLRAKLDELKKERDKVSE